MMQFVEKKDTELKLPEKIVKEDLLSLADKIITNKKEEIKQLEPYHEFELSNFSGYIVGKSVAVNFE
jgi:hypothetical protein